MESINTEFSPFLSINECNRLILSYFPLPEVSTGTVIIMKEERKEEEKVYIWILNLNEHKWSSFNNIGRGFSALDLKSHYEIELLPRNTSLWLEGGLTENRCVFLDIIFFFNSTFTPTFKRTWCSVKYDKHSKARNMTRAIMPGLPIWLAGMPLKNTAAHTFLWTFLPV